MSRSEAQMAAKRATNRQAVELTLTTLRGENRLTDEHEALVMAARSMAAACDSEPQNASLWREYHALLMDLTRVGAGGSDDDTQAFLVSIQTPGVRPAVRNTKKP